MKRITFVGTDQKEYAFNISDLGDNTSDLTILENFKNLSKCYSEIEEMKKKGDENDLSSFNKIALLTDSFWNILANEFKKAFPEHRISEEYHYGELSLKGKLIFSDLLGTQANLLNLMEQVFSNENVLINSNIISSKRGRPKKINE